MASLSERILAEVIPKKRLVHTYAVCGPMKSRVFLSYMNSPRLESPKRLSFNGTQSPSYIYSVGATLSLTHEEHIEEQKLVLYPAL